MSKQTRAADIKVRSMSLCIVCIIVATFSKFESGRLYACVVIPLCATMVGTELEHFEVQGL